MVEAHERQQPHLVQHAAVADRHQAAAQVQQSPEAERPQHGPPQRHPPVHHDDQREQHGHEHRVHRRLTVAAGSADAEEQHVVPEAGGREPAVLPHPADHQGLGSAEARQAPGPGASGRRTRAARSRHADGRGAGSTEAETADEPSAASTTVSAASSASSGVPRTTRNSGRSLTGPPASTSVGRPVDKS